MMLSIKVDLHFTISAGGLENNVKEAEISNDVEILFYFL